MSGRFSTPTEPTPLSGMRGFACGSLLHHRSGSSKQELASPWEGVSKRNLYNLVLCLFLSQGLVVSCPMLLVQFRVVEDRFWRVRAGGKMTQYLVILLQ